MSRSDEAAPSLHTRVKVYLEDTDAGGIVYHANYLKYFERARTDWLEEHGVGLKGAQDRGFRFVVHALSIQYHRPALLGDWLEIDTTVRRASPFRLVFDHRARRGADSDALTSCKVDVVCIDAEGELCEIEANLIRFA